MINYDKNLPMENLVESNSILYQICQKNDVDTFLTLNYEILFDKNILNWTDKYENNCIMIGLENNASDDLLLGIMSSNELDLKHHNIYDRSILLKACFKGRLKIVEKIIELYIENNLNLNEVDIFNYNAYLAACISNNSELVKYLDSIESINKNQLTFDGKGAFLIACQYDSIHVAKYLFKKELNSHHVIEFLLKLEKAKELSKTHFYLVKTRNVSAFLNQQYKLLQEINTIENMFPKKLKPITTLNLTEEKGQFKLIL
jgi:ankyrin repeat protein